jgi:hypothetical protein
MCLEVKEKKKGGACSLSLSCFLGEERLAARRRKRKKKGAESAENTQKQTYKVIFFQAL